MKRKYTTKEDEDEAEKQKVIAMMWNTMKYGVLGAAAMGLAHENLWPQAAVQPGNIFLLLHGYYRGAVPPA
jgi:hypothetical protein